MTGVAESGVFRRYSQRRIPQSFGEAFQLLNRLWRVTRLQDGHHRCMGMVLRVRVASKKLVKPFRYFVALPK